MKALGSVVNSEHYWPAVAEGSTLVKRHTARMHVLREPSGEIKWASVVRGKLDAANLEGGVGSQYSAECVKELCALSHACMHPSIE